MFKTIFKEIYKSSFN